MCIRDSQLSDKNNITVFLSNGTSHEYEATYLDTSTSKKVFGRTGEVEKIVVSIVK